MREERSIFYNRPPPPWPQADRQSQPLLWLPTELSARLPNEPQPRFLCDPARPALSEPLPVFSVSCLGRAAEQPSTRPCLEQAKVYSCFCIVELCPPFFLVYLYNEVPFSSLFKGTVSTRYFSLFFSF
jgi:hypothetical protein